MKIAVCEDLPADMAALCPLLDAYGAAHPSLGLSVDCYPSPDALLGVSTPYDIYLLDVLLGEKTGIELARELRRRFGRIALLFLTSSPDYALPAFAVHALDYLLKPVDRPLLFEALDTVLESWQFQPRGRAVSFSIRTPNGLHTAAVGDVVYVEIVGHTPYFHLVSGVVRGSELRVSFGEAMSPLLTAGCFLQPHRSFYVNAAHVVALSPQSVRLTTGDAIPVVRTRSAETRTQYLDYLVEEETHA